jgi:hypothetical protein
VLISSIPPHGTALYVCPSLCGVLDHSMPMLSGFISDHPLLDRQPIAVGPACPALRRRSPDLFCSARGGSWPTAEMPPGGRGDRLLGYCGRGSASGAKTDRAKLHSKLPAPGCCFPDSLRRYCITRAGSGLWPVMHVIIRFIPIRRLCTQTQQRGAHPSAPTRRFRAWVLSCSSRLSSSL